MKTRPSGDLNIQSAVNWLDSFYPPQHGFEKPEDQPPIFPNGFDSWQETHFEIVNLVQLSAERRGSLSYKRHEDCGTGGLYQLAREMTDKFEKENEGRVWDGDFFEEIEAFCRREDL